MIPNIPVVPPDSVIKTFPSLSGDRVDLVLSQDADGLSEHSFIIRGGDWAEYLLDAWYDPVYRTYNFQKAERHALEHIVQWHSTVLAKLALVPQHILNSYSTKMAQFAASNGVYKEGHFIMSFGPCYSGARRCEIEMQPYVTTLDKQQHDSGT